MTCSKSATLSPCAARMAAVMATAAVRRDIRALALALLWLAVAWHALAQTAQAQTARPTPTDDYGPFYPIDWSGEIDADLSSFAGKKAEGIILTLSGTVRDTERRALRNAVVEIWQTDSRGRYRHPGVPETYRDPAFQGYGRVFTDAGGHYRFTTILPGRYGSRPPHVHLRVAPAGKPEFVTQIYFRGDNREGGPTGRLPPGRESLTVEVTGTASDTRAARFDIFIPD